MKAEKFCPQPPPRPQKVQVSVGALAMGHDLGQILSGHRLTGRMNRVFLVVSYRIIGYRLRNQIVGGLRLR